MASLLGSVAGPPPGPIAWRRLGPALASAALAFPALVLAVRGLTGALTTPLPLGPLAAAALAALAVAALGARLAPPRGFWRLAPVVALAWCMLALALATGGPWAILLLGGLTAIEAAWCLAPAWESSRPTDRSVSEPGVGGPLAETDRLEDESGEPPSSLVASLERERYASGEESITGRVRVDFAPGQRTGRAHVAFCPPLGEVPRIEYEQSDGPEARVQIGQALAQGARFDVKLAEEPSETAQVWIDYVASCGSAPGWDESATDNEG